MVFSVQFSIGMKETSIWEAHSAVVCINARFFDSTKIPSLQPGSIAHDALVFFDAHISWKCQSFCAGHDNKPYLSFWRVDLGCASLSLTDLTVYQGL